MSANLGSICSKIILGRNGSRIFSRVGGANFRKKNQKFFRHCSKVDQIDSPSSPKASKRPCFSQIFWAAGKFLKKQAKLEKFDQKSRFFDTHALLKIGIYWRRKRLLVFYGRHQIWISQNKTKENIFSNQGCYFWAV